MESTCCVDMEAKVAERDWHTGDGEEEVDGVDGDGEEFGIWKCSCLNRRGGEEGGGENGGAGGEENDGEGVRRGRGGRGGVEEEVAEGARGMSRSQTARARALVGRLSLRLLSSAMQRRRGLDGGAECHMRGRLRLAAAAAGRWTDQSRAMFIVCWLSVVQME